MEEFRLGRRLHVSLFAITATILVDTFITVVEILHNARPSAILASCVLKLLIFLTQM